MAATRVTFDEMMERLHSQANPDNAAGMARFGIHVDRALGVSVNALRAMARGVRDHELAAQLWATGIHEAQMLAAMVDDPTQVTPAQMDAWAAEFDSWDLCDTVTGTLFDKTPYAVDKALEWAGREEEYVRRAGFALMAWLAVHDKKASDETFLRFLPVIAAHAGDGRKDVKKAVNWALRQIGKRRSPVLYAAALETARALAKSDTAAARWVGKDAVRELEARGV